MTPARPEYARIRLALAASAYFGELPAASLDSLAEAAKLERWPRGGLLHTAGKPLDRLWFVLEGGLMISILSSRGRAIPVAMLGPGSFYSAAALVEGALPHSECHAERDTVLAAIATTSLHQLQLRDPALASLVPRLLLQRFQAVLALYADSVATPLPERLARRLLAQALTVTSGCNAGGEIELRSSQADLARMLGASRSKLNAELRRLEEQQVLRLGYRRIYLRDCDRLGQIAGERVPLN